MTNHENYPKRETDWDRRATEWDRSILPFLSAIEHGLVDSKMKKNHTFEIIERLLQNDRQSIWEKCRLI